MRAADRSEAGRREAYAAFVERLFGQNQFAMKLGLEAMKQALEEAQHPERTHRAILIAGTNGKGTTAAFLAGILQAHGLRVGLYTSPHLTDLRERFRIDGRPVDQDLAFAVGQEVLGRYGGPSGDRPALTFFELTTVMAVSIFARAEVDVAIYEIGLGGRLDAVNAIEPSLSVVTTIDFDHTQYLGDRIEQITSEKCGIFRPGVPAVLGFQDHRAAIMTSRALEREGRCGELRLFGEHFDATRLGAPGRAMAEVTGRNAATAMEAARVFLADAYDDACAFGALERVRWPGRLERRSLTVPGFEPRRFLLDAAHNPAGVEALRRYIQGENLPIGAVVCGAMGDKDLEPMFGWLARLGRPVFASLVDNPRSASQEALRQVLGGADVRLIGPTRSCLEEAIGATTREETILVFGSIYLLGECLSIAGLGADDLRTYLSFSDG